MPSVGFVVLLRILAAHILADFFLQRYEWIIDKRAGIKSSSLYIHVAIVGGLTYLFLADWSNWQLPLFIMVSHFFIDWWKSTQQKSTQNFIIDQLLHLLMLIIAWLWYIGISFSETISWIASGFGSTVFWVILCSYLLVLRPMGFLIGKATNSWQVELQKLPPTFGGLTDAGRWIGYLERVLILTFILIGQYSAIGLLIAAKSIFRYSGKVDDEDKRKHIEYILIGTLMSFLMAVVIGIIARYSLGY